MFLRNYWYVAAYDTELEPGKIVGRTLLSEPVALFRTPEGRAHAFEDRCCHRRAPLSLGRMIGDKVQCGYHGIVYTPDGKVVGIPGQTMVPPDARVRVYPVVERHRFVWIWMGDPAQADPAKIPDHLYDTNDAPKRWSAVGGYLNFKCNYRLLVENLLDLTHETFLHAKTIGNEHVANTPLAEVDRDEKGVTATRWMIGITAPPLFARAGRLAPDTKVDRWQIIRWEPPAHVTLDVGVAHAGTGAPEGNRAKGISHWVMDAITPETESSTHYFWAFSRNYRLDDRELSEYFQTAVTATFLEDQAMLEGQQRIIEAAPSAPEIDINADMAQMQFRRLIKRFFEQDAQAARGTRAAAE